MAVFTIILILKRLLIKSQPIPVGGQCPPYIRAEDDARSFKRIKNSVVGDRTIIER